jgi:hypothetical protein
LVRKLNETKTLFMKKELSMLMAPAIAFAMIAINNPAQAQTQVTLVSSPNAGIGIVIPTLRVQTSSTGTNTQQTDGILVETGGGWANYGITSITTGGGNYNEGMKGISSNAGITGIGVVGISDGAVSSNYGVYAVAQNGANNWAGYFNGDVYTTGSYLPSDEKLKRDVKVEGSIMQKIKQLKPVSYNYRSGEISYMQLPKNRQHGLVAQELKEIFPEMVTEVEHPIFVKNKFEGSEKMLAINYTMLIPVLIKSVQEQQEYIEKLEEKINQLAGKQPAVFGTPEQSAKGLYLGQNVPNPSGYATEIKYSIPDEISQASIAVFDLTGKMLLQYKNLRGNSQVVINKSMLASGSYIYSLIVNGQEVVTKKMIIAR